MRAETALAGALAVVVVASLVAVAVVPGALAGPEDEPGRAHLADATVATAAVASDAVTLTVTSTLAHRGGTSENLSVRVRMVHLESGLHAETREVAVSAVEGDTEIEVPVNVTVPREGGYRVTVLLYDDGSRRGELQRDVRGVGSLKPPAAESAVRFHRFDRQAGNDTLPAVQTAVETTDGDEVTLNVSAYLTNDGDDETGDLSVQFVLRQAESGLVADRTRVPLGAVPAQHTATPATTVTVPDDYNYYVDAILWKGGVILDSARGVANLDPDESIRVNHSSEEDGLQVGDFARGGGGDAPLQGATPTAEATPGFGTAVALLALATVALFTRRHA